MSNLNPEAAKLCVERAAVLVGTVSIPIMMATHDGRLIRQKMIVMPLGTVTDSQGHTSMVWSIGPGRTGSNGPVGQTQAMIRLKPNGEVDPSTLDGVTMPCEMEIDVFVKQADDRQHIETAGILGACIDTKADELDIELFAAQQAVELIQQKRNGGPMERNFPCVKSIIPDELLGYEGAGEGKPLLWVAVDARDLTPVNDPEPTEQPKPFTPISFEDSPCRFNRSSTVTTRWFTRRSRPSFCSQRLCVW